MRVSGKVTVAIIGGICLIGAAIIGLAGNIYTSKNAPDTGNQTIIINFNGEQVEVKPSEVKEKLNEFSLQIETLSGERDDLLAENKKLESSLESLSNTSENNVSDLVQENEQLKQELVLVSSENDSLREHTATMEDDLEKHGIVIPPLEGTFLYLEAMKTFLDGTEDNWEMVTSFISNVNTVYQHGIWYNGNYDEILDKTYLLNSQYSKFTASIVVNEYWTAVGKDNNIGEVSIFADDVEIFSSGPISSDTIAPIEINLDLNNVTKLQIRGTADEYHGGGYYGILDAKFIIK